MLDFSAFKAPFWQFSRSKGQNLDLLLEAEDAPRSAADRFVLGEPAYRQSAALLRRASAESLAGNLSETRALLEQALRINPADRMAQAALDELLTKPAKSRGASP